MAAPDFKDSKQNKLRDLYGHVQDIIEFHTAHGGGHGHHYALFFDAKKGWREKFNKDFREFYR